MELIDATASNIGYAVITAIISTLALVLVVAWRPAYLAAQVLFLVAWGIIGVAAPIYSFVAITIPQGTYISGTIGSLMVLIIGGGPFFYYGWPKLRQTMSPR